MILKPSWFAELLQKVLNVSKWLTSLLLLYIDMFGNGLTVLLLEYIGIKLLPKPPIMLLSVIKVGSTRTDVRLHRKLHSRITRDIPPIFLGLYMRS